MSKRIIYSMPVDILMGSLTGAQNLTYGESGGSAYDVADGQRIAAKGYTPNFIAKYCRKTQARYFQVRTRSTINMTANMRRNLALMGGTGAIIAALLRDKTANIYAACVAACPAKTTLRAFLAPIIRAGLAAKSASITIASGVTITNPWIDQGAQTLNIRQDIIDKFSSVLS